MQEPQIRNIAECLQIRGIEGDAIHRLGRGRIIEITHSVDPLRTCALGPDAIDIDLAEVVGISGGHRDISHPVGFSRNLRPSGDTLSSRKGCAIAG